MKADPVCINLNKISNQKPS